MTKSGRDNSNLRFAFFAVFLVFSLIMLIFPIGLPIELWDESRIANNAIETAMHGHWLAPTYSLVSDHWNTKPPLLIWIIAALERLGLPPIIALRFPSALSALATVLILYFFCRKILNRPFVGIAAALLLMGSTLIFGRHVAMTGDYDALLCLFTTIFALSIFCFVEPIEPFAGPGIFLAAIALSLAVLTKGVAGVLFLPGIFFYVIARSRLSASMRNRNFWIASLAFILVCAVYYKGRDIVDPGYMHSVWYYELHRYNEISDAHHGRALHYANYLVHHFEPGMVLVPLGFFSLGGWGSRGSSRGAAILCGIVALTFLVVLMTSQTRIFYYCAPAVPLLSIFAAIGLDDIVVRFSRHDNGGSNYRAISRHQNIIFIVLVCGLIASTVSGLHDSRSTIDTERTHYGEILHQLRSSGVHSQVVIVDSGFVTSMGWHGYNPIVDYYAKEATFLGLPTTVQASAQNLPANAWVISCDPSLISSIRRAPIYPGNYPPSERCRYGRVEPDFAF